MSDTLCTIDGYGCWVAICRDAPAAARYVCRHPAVRIVEDRLRVVADEPPVPDFCPAVIRPENRAIS